MMFFKSGRIAFDKAITYINFGESSGKYGFILFNKSKNTLIGRHSLANLNDMQKYIKSLGLSDVELNESQIAFCVSENTMPLAVCKYEKGLGLLKNADNLVMLDTSRMYPTRNKLPLYKGYVTSVLSGFTKDTLENNIQFLSKYGIFENITFILCNKNNGFKFVGDFRDKKGSTMCNGDIRNHKYMVYSSF